MKVTTKILLSRLLTRSGDQAWDFAVPLVLIATFPANVRVAFIYFFIVRLGAVVFMPYAGRLIDTLPRKKSMQIGIGLQALAVSLTAILIFLLQQMIDKTLAYDSVSFVLFLFLLLMGFVSVIASGIMDIAVSNDWVPSVLPPVEWPHFNSRLRQLDLITEVASPVLTGLILMLSWGDGHLIGFYLIVAWNVASFIPEYVLLNQIISEKPQLNLKKIVPHALKRSFKDKLTSGWSVFVCQPAAPVIAAYTLLWLSVLSPHGVLLTAFLKNGWSLSEPLIGGFRALGAVFGISATFIYPRLRAHFGLVVTSKAFILFQAAMVTSALVVFFWEGTVFRIIFLILILLSRIGLYGFGLGETELRQGAIPEELRGEVNGVASSLTSLATLIIFGLGILLSSPEDFRYLVFISVVAVSMAAIYFFFTADKAIGSIP